MLIATLKNTSNILNQNNLQSQLNVSEDKQFNQLTSEVPLPHMCSGLRLGVSLSSILKQLDERGFQEDQKRDALYVLNHEICSIYKVLQRNENSNKSYFDYLVSMNYKLKHPVIRLLNKMYAFNCGQEQKSMLGCASK